ncbi:MAG: hypothetical protein ITG02_01105 [Patulibacter sp.]|nr:hypothetical protein [Patulibacter sp.]
MKTALEALDGLALPHGVKQDVAERLRKGAEEYGDDSFRRARRELLREIREEALDAIGWTVVLMVRDGIDLLDAPLQDVVTHAGWIVRHLDSLLDEDAT